MQFKKTVEEETCVDVMNLTKRDACAMIRERGLVDNILEENKKKFPKTDPCYISHRINLKLWRGRVISAKIG